MQKLTDFIRCLVQEYGWRDQKIDFSRVDTYYFDNELVYAPPRPTRTFMDYSPLEIQKILDLAG